MTTQKKIASVPADALAAARLRAKQTRQQLGHEPGPTELLTPQELADAAPFYRVFNPITQALKFDPDGDYVRRWVPELRGVEGKAVHEPWDLPHGLPAGYPERIVDHKKERQVALSRYQDAKS